MPTTRRRPPIARRHLTLGAVLLAALLAPAALGAGGGEEGFLHTRGEDIVDGAGQKIMLRGVGLGNWTLPEGYMWKFGDQGDRPRRIEKIVSDLIGPEDAAKFWQAYRANYIAQPDIQRIAQLGFNSVRPSLDARLFLSEGDHPAYQEEGFAIVDHLLQWSKAAGVYVIIDMHAAPGGQTGQNIDDSANDQPELFMDPKYQDRLVDLWVKIAARYKDDPTVAAYDLLNEPLPKRTGAAAKYGKELEPLYQRIARAIRTVDKHHMITVEGEDWANDWSVFTAPFDSNLVYQFHYYCWSNPTELKGIGQYLAKREQLKAPVWVGETGEKDDTIYWATTDYFESNNIGWSFWPWKKMDAGNGIYSITPPKNWEAIAAYSRGGDKPSREVSEAAFQELLHNIRMENCTYFPDVVNALFHRVPGKVEAENYGHEGLNKSYFVKDSKTLSKDYRKAEPVPVELIAGGRGSRRRGGGGGGGGGGQAIRLGADEWTAYEINAPESRAYAISIRAKAEPASAKGNAEGAMIAPAQAPAATVELSINGQTQEVKVAANDWTILTLQPALLQKGGNHVKLAVKQGTAQIDWLIFK